MASESLYFADMQCAKLDHLLSFLVFFYVRRTAASKLYHTFVYILELDNQFIRYMCLFMFKAENAPSYLAVPPRTEKFLHSEEIAKCLHPWSIRHHVIGIIQCVSKNDTDVAYISVVF